jgi:hypothetical protein
VRTNLVPTIAVLVAAVGTLCAAETTAPARTPRFTDYPFEQWAAAPERSAIKWEVHLLPPQLSVHQRLVERIQTIVPGSELEKRRGRGELVLLVRFEDSDGRHWRAGSRLDLVKVQEGVKSDELTFTISAFIRPGEYKVLVALIDSKTMEHSFTRRTLHVAPLKNDPLPDAWAGLPSVEVLPVVDTPDAWSLPEVKGMLRLPAGSKTANTAPQVELLVNMTPSERSPNSAGSLRRNMSVVIPALKVLSSLNAENRPASAAVMDLTRQRIGLEAPNAGTLDWSALGKLMTASNPSVIDAKSLAVQSSMRDYFVREVVRRAGDSGPPRWIIVLSGPLTFSRQDETPLPQIPPDPNRHIVCLRFLSAFRGAPMGAGATDVQIGPPERVRGPTPGLGTVLPMPPGRGRGEMLFPDDIEHVLKPMGAQIIVVETPEAFRKTIAALIAEIAAN